MVERHEEIITVHVFVLNGVGDVLQDSRWNQLFISRLQIFFFYIKPSITVQCVSVFAILSMICECLFLNLPMYLNIWSNHCIKWKMCDRHIAFQKMKIIFVISHFHRMSYSKQYWNAISNLFLPCSQIKVNKTGILSTSVEPSESDYWNLNKQIENL